MAPSTGQVAGRCLGSTAAGHFRHIVRFAYLGGSVIAIKETSERAARHEYRMLRQLGRLGAPCVKPVAEVTGRADEHGEPLSPALVTRHLRFSLPYRAVFNQMMRKDTLQRLIDAQALLMVELHLLGFYWGTCHCRTPSSAGMPVTSRLIWWTLKLVSSIRNFQPGSVNTIWRLPRSTSQVS